MQFGRHHLAAALAALVLVVIVVVVVRRRRAQNFIVELETTNQLTNKQVPGCVMLTQQGETVPC